VSLAGQWRTIQSELPAGWADARLRLTMRDPHHADRAAALLAPAQPYRIEPRELRFSASTNGASAGPEAVRRLLARLDGERIVGELELLASEAAATAPVQAETTLAESWAAALHTLPPDWSDLLGEVELTSTDFIDRGALLMAPLNPRREGPRPVLRFRSAQTFGYGASAAMVRRCLERCDEEGIHGEVRILQALSDTKNVATQGPVWQLEGRTV